MKNGNKTKAELIKELKLLREEREKGVFKDIINNKEAGKILKESEKIQQKLFENMMDGLILHRLITDKNGHPVDYILLKVNKAAEKILSWDRKDIEGKKATEVYNGDTPFIERYAKVAQTGKAKYFIDYYFGFKKWYEITSFCPEKGYFANIFKDITERKQAEEALYKSQQEFASLFKSSPEALVHVDKKSKILDINAQFTKLFGYTLEEIKGRNVDNGMIHSQKMIDEGKNLTKKALKGFVNYETIRKRKDGSEFSVFISSAPVKVNNKLKGLVTLYQDITERKKAEEELRQSEEKFAGIFKNIPDAAFYQDTKGIILDINPAFTQLFGYTREDVLGKSIDKIGLYPKDKMKEGKDLTRKNLNEDLSNFETVRQKKDGNLIPVRISTSFVKIKDKVTGVIALYHDITKRKQNEQLQQALYNISKAANSLITLNQLYKTIHKELGNIIDTTNFYIALLDEKKGKIYFPYHIDEMGDEFEPQSLEYKSLTCYVIRNKRPLLLNYDKIKELNDSGELLNPGVITKDIFWFGVPLKVEDKVIGAMAVQSYTNPKLYSEKDTTLLEFVSSQVATAIERKRTEEALKTSQQEFSNLFLSSPEAAVYHDEKGVILNINPRFTELFGYTLEEIKGKNINEGMIFPQNNTVKESERLTRLALEGKVVAFETIRKKKNNSLISVIISVAPVITEGQHRGVIAFYQDITERKQAEERLKNALDAAIETMSKIIEVKDPYTAGHQQRVSQLTTAISKELNFSPDKIEGIRIASLIHDIGKISVPTEILSKPATLSDIEFNLIKGHSQIGYDILKAIDFSYPVANIVLQHHEKIDGSGYPNNLKGDKILLEARIICVADVVEAMSSHRPYRPSLGINAALEEISKNRGVLYDPEVVDICLKLFKEKEFKFE